MCVYVMYSHTFLKLYGFHGGQTGIQDFVVHIPKSRSTCMIIFLELDSLEVNSLSFYSVILTVVSYWWRCCIRLYGLLLTSEWTSFGWHL